MGDKGGEMRIRQDEPSEQDAKLTPGEGDEGGSGIGWRSSGCDVASESCSTQESSPARAEMARLSHSPGAQAGAGDCQGTVWLQMKARELEVPRDLLSLLLKGKFFPKGDPSSLPPRLPPTVTRWLSWLKLGSLLSNLGPWSKTLDMCIQGCSDMIGHLGQNVKCLYLDTEINDAERKEGGLAQWNADDHELITSQQGDEAARKPSAKN